MKKAKISLLAMTALFLVGCNRRTPVTSKSSSSEPKTTQTTTKKPTTTSKPTTSKPTDGKTTTAKPTTPATTDIYHSTKWDKEIVDLMLEHLNGNIVPYAEIAENNIYLVPEWDETYLDLNIYGDPFSPEHVSNAAISFQAAGWDVVAEANSMKATLASQNLEVEVHEVTDYGDYKGLTVLTARRYEPYDSSKLTSWSQDIKDLFTSNLHGHELPLIYLGTATPVGQSLSSQPDSMSVLGGRWDDRVITENKTLLENAGWNTSDVNQTGMTATKVEEDGCTLTVVFSRTVSSKRAQFKAYFVEKFDPNVKSDWEDATKTLIANNMDNHEVTYVYLGKTVESASLNYKGDEITIVGGKWNDAILTNAQKVLSNDGWTEVKIQPLYEGANSQYLSAKKTFDDNCSMTINIDKNVNGDASMTIKFHMGYHVPLGATWSTDTLTAFATNLDNHVLPYVYLNTVAETVEWDEENEKLTITGGSWDDLMVEEFKKVYEAQTDVSWTVTTNPGYSAKAIGTFADGCKATITLNSNYDDKAYISVDFFKKYEVPAGASWTADTVSKFKDNFDGHILPFIYLNGTEVSSVTTSGNKIELVGGKWNEGVFAEAERVLKNDGYSEIKKTPAGSLDRSDNLTATKLFGDSCIFKVTLKSDNNNKVYLAVEYTEGYVAPTGEDAKWSDDIKSKMKTALNDYVIPYFYMGTKAPTISTSTSDPVLTVTGANWRNEILENAKSALEADGFKTSTQEGDYARTLVASKRILTADKNDVVFVSLTKNYSSKAEMKVYYQNATGVSFDNSKSYSEEDQATFVEVTKEVAPYLDMGTPSISYKGDTYLQVKGSDGSYSLAALNNVYDTLNTNGYTSNYFLNGSSIEVRATKERADHSLLTLKYTKYSGTAAYYELHYFPPFVAPKGDAAKWSDAIISIFNDNFSGHVLPYVYLGIDEPTYSWNSSSRNLTINGKTWNDSIWKSFEDTYSADDYELVWDYSSKDKALLASKTFSDGVLVTVKLTKNGDTPRLDCFVR